MSAESEGELDDDINNGSNQTYFMSSEDNQLVLSMLVLDLDYLCRKIEDNLKS